MKIRNGFVSNSSSSSFIVRLTTIPQSVQELKVMLLGEDAPFFVQLYTDSYPVDMVVETIFRDIQAVLRGRAKKNVSNAINRSQIYIGEYNLHEYDNLVDPSFRKQYSDLQKQVFEIKNKLREAYNMKDREEDAIGKIYRKQHALSNKMIAIVKKSMELNADETDMFIPLHYGDEDGGLHAYIEHSGILNNILVKRISHH